MKHLFYSGARAALLFISLCAALGLHAQQRIHVDLDATGFNNGTSWQDAFTELSSALAVATAGDEIWVAEGTYYPQTAFDVDGSGGSDPRERMFYIATDSLKIYGGFAGTETMLSQRDASTRLTVLSGDLGVANDKSDNAYHVFYLDGRVNPGGISRQTVIDGFTIRDGYANGANRQNWSGGGMYLDASEFAVTQPSDNVASPTISNCVFTQNCADPNFNSADISRGSGGAIFANGARGTVSPRITDCDFIQNRAERTGRGGHSFSLRATRTEERA